MPKLRTEVKPGFVRVLVQDPNHPHPKQKTIQIRVKHAANPEYMRRHHLILLPEPTAPAPVAPPPAKAEAPKTPKATPSVSKKTNTPT